MSEREKIFARIRDALTVASPKPGSHDFGVKPSPVTADVLATARSAATGAKDWLPAVGASSAEWVTLFSKNSFDLKTDVIIAANEQAAHIQLQIIADEQGWKTVATHGSGIASRATGSLGLPTLTTDGGYDVNELETCDVGISECDALIAQTGSVLLTSRSGGGRALSVLPPHHVVIARIDQLVPDLPAAYELLHHSYDKAGWPSMITVITGPSRTGDIERILVLGAHGPKKLTVILY